MLKPQDVMVLLRLAGERPEWTFKHLAQDLGLSPSEAHAALERASAAGLYDPKRRKVREHALLELVIHGIRYVFPARRLPRCRGIPTAHSMEPLSAQLVVAADDCLVWPHPEGPSFGDGIEPLYRSAPDAARQNPRLHRRLALLDALRIGRVRERKLAAEALDQELRA